MFMNSGLALFFVVIKLLEGLLIGLVVAALRYRSRLTPRFAVTPTAFSGVAFILVSGLAGWAGEHAAFQNGHRMDVAPWGKICGCET